MKMYWFVLATLLGIIAMVVIGMIWGSNHPLVGFIAFSLLIIIALSVICWLEEPTNYRRSPEQIAHDNYIGEYFSEELAESAAAQAELWAAEEELKVIQAELGRSGYSLKEELRVTKAKLRMAQATLKAERRGVAYEQGNTGRAVDLAR